MIPFNLYGLIIIVPCGSIAYLVFSRLEPWIETTSFSNGFWIGIFCLAIFTLSSCCALLFDRTNIPGVIPSYQKLWRQFFYGERLHPKSRVAGVFIPLAMSPCLIIFFTVLFFLIEHVILTPPQEPLLTYVILIGLSSVSCVLCYCFAILTEKIRLIRDETDKM